MDVDTPVAGPSVSPAVNPRAQARRRAKLQKAAALKRQLRNVTLESSASYPLPKPLPTDWEGDDGSLSRSILLAEYKETYLREIGRALAAEDLQSRGLQFLELPPEHGNPFGDISRILTEVAEAEAIRLKTQLQTPLASPNVPPTIPAPPHERPSSAAEGPGKSSTHQTNGFSAAAKVNMPAKTAGMAIPVAPILRKADGAPMLPQTIDGFRILSLGHFPVIPGFFEAGNIFAPGYRIVRPFLSTSPGAANVVGHLCEIFNNDGAPLFKIFAEDSQRTVESFSIIEAWVAIGRPAFELRGYRCNETAEAALDFFGLSVPRIRLMLMELVPPDIPLDRIGLKRLSWVEKPTANNDPNLALRTVETTLVRVSASQAIETVVKPAIVTSATSSATQLSRPTSSASNSRRGSHTAETLSPAAIPGRRYSENADELARGYPNSYGSPVPGAGILMTSLSSRRGSSPQFGGYSMAAASTVNGATSSSITTGATE